MKEEDLLEKIKKSADSVSPPESLKRENISRLLDNEKNSAIYDKKNIYKKYGFAAAACLVLAVSFWHTRIPVTPSSTSATTASDSSQDVMAENTVIKGTSEEGISEGGNIEKYAAASYDEIYNKIEEMQKKEELLMERQKLSAGAGTVESAGAESVSVNADTAETEELVSSSDYSSTNVQVEGIDEGDIVKTDGKYIYIADKEESLIRIAETSGDDVKVVGDISFSSSTNRDSYLLEFYIKDNRLTLIRQSYDSVWPGRNISRERVYIETYDISSRDKPELIGSIAQDGYYQNSRRSGDYIYTITNHYAGNYARTLMPADYIPMIDNEVIPYNSIYLPENIKSCSFMVVTAVNIEKPEEAASKKAVMADGSQFYMSHENMYIGSTKYDGRANQYNYTEILKLSYKDGVISYKAHCYADGYLNNQFSMDEYKGNLRMVTTLSYANGKDTNSLFILDENLEKLGEINDLAVNERIYSARFMGDAAYFVTFRNMDPLFSADLSDPKNPRILGELKITGFSQYLHSFDDKLLLGIGQEINPDTGNFEGMKLSMFDISNPSDVSEKDKEVVREFENCAAWYNHKACFIAPAKGLTGFAVDCYDKNTRSWTARYVIYSYNRESGFKKILDYELADFDNTDVRGLFIGDFFYVVENSRITVFKMTNFAKAGQIKY